MLQILCIRVQLLDCRFHGRGEHSLPEWPPSPLRVFQALVAGAAAYYNERKSLKTAVDALAWLQSQAPPQIVAPRTIVSANPYRLYVPDNVADKVAKSWCRGNAASIADYRSEKDVRPVHVDGDAIYYLYEQPSECPFLEILSACSRGVTHLGWGVDQAIVSTSLIEADRASRLVGDRWEAHSAGRHLLRTPNEGTLEALKKRHDLFLGRLKARVFQPVPPLTAFRATSYRLIGNGTMRPHAVFELRHDVSSFSRYPLAKLMHIAGMVRHLAIRVMRHDPPRDVADPDQWIDRYIAGHARNDTGEHHQLSYVPLPSIGHRYTDPAIRRVMIVAPLGDDAWLEHLAQRLGGRQLQPEYGAEFGQQGPPSLIRIRGDNVTRCYTEPANRWASVTPVILPGFDDRKRAKREKLIRKALRSAGIEQECEFEWSPVSQFPKVLPAHPKDRAGRPIYYKPAYLQNYTSVHLTLKFDDDLKVPGPLALGAGRHCGFGLMAPCP